MKWLAIILFLSFFSIEQSDEIIQDYTVDTERACISQDEKALVQAINSYRKKKGLSSITISNSLSIVSQKHVKELNDQIKNLTHSWVDCPYKSSDPKSYNCMWEKPKELTGYPSRGYECAFAQWGKAFTPEEVLEGWKNSPSHNAIIVNKGVWKSSEWNAIGVAIYGNYAVLWLGEDTDPNGLPAFCK